MRRHRRAAVPAVGVGVGEPRGRLGLRRGALGDALDGDDLLAAITASGGSTGMPSSGRALMLRGHESSEDGHFQPEPDDDDDEPQDIADTTPHSLHDYPPLDGSMGPCVHMNGG